jgi:flagellar hook-basal body complex protein FliE
MIEAIAAIGTIPAAGTTTSVTQGASAGGPSFADALKNAAADTVGSVKASEELAALAMNGQANLQDVVQATISAELALETALSVRNKVVEGVQEILRMPV